MSLRVLQPSRVTVMIKPVGALCNLDCHYCYYLPTKAIYDGREHRMKLSTLEEIFAGVLPKFADEVTIAWQGGEPTLAGLDFFEKAIEYQEKYRRPGQTVMHALQTNGTLLNDDWCKFLKKHDFLIGLSVDGPPRFHDHYRLTNRQDGSSDQVLRGHRYLQKHAVEYNILCVLNDVNVHHPVEVFQYLLKLGSRWVQFIPAVEWEPDPENPGKTVMAPYSPDPHAYGEFLCKAFDLWFEKYRKRVSVRIFDAVLNKLVLGQMPFCILDGACHSQMTIEHDGAVFGCDHFVERRWQLAQIGDRQWKNEIALDGSMPVGLRVHGEMFKEESHAGRDIDTVEDMQTLTPQDDASVNGLDMEWFDRTENERIGQFAARKQNLPEKCKVCQFKAFCYGGCPKHRPQGGDVPEASVLCPGYIRFYEHTLPRFEWLARYIRAGQQPPDPEAGPVEKDRKVVQNREKQVGSGSGRSGAGGAGGGGRAKIGRNDPCPCGSGLKYKHCHGRNQ